MKYPFTIVVAVLTVLVMSAPLSAKSETVKIVIRGAGLTTPIEISDPDIVRKFNVWTGPGVRINGEAVYLDPNQQAGAFIDWPKGAVAERPQGLQSFQVFFYVTHSSERPAYVVSYEYEPSTEGGYIYVPGKADDWYASNVSTILHGIEGKWFHASNSWETIVRPLIDQARSFGQLQRVKALLFPYTLDTGNPQLKNTFVGVAVANLSERPERLFVTGLDASGIMNASVQIPFSVAAQGQQALLTSDITAPNAISLLVSNTQETLQGFFMVGDNTLKRLDGVGGELKEGTLLYFPFVRHQGGETTFLFLYNPNEVDDPTVSLKLFDKTGMLIGTKTISLPSRGSLTGTIDRLFGENLNIPDGFIEVNGSLPVKGFEFYVRAEYLAAVTAQAALATRRFLVPHFFVSNDGGNTELRVINADTSSITVRIKGFDDKGAALGTGEFLLEPGKLLIGDVKQLLNLDTSKLKEFEALTGYLDLELFAAFGSLQKTPSVLGTVSFVGVHGKSYSMLPLAAEGTLETVFPHVAQSSQLGVFTGVAILNAASTTARVRIQAFDENGIRTGEKLLDLPAGRRIVGLLNESSFFGAAFNQVKGHLRVSSLPTAAGAPAVPVISFAVFGDADQNYLSAIEGQKPVR